MLHRLVRFAAASVLLFVAGVEIAVVFSRLAFTFCCVFLAVFACYRHALRFRCIPRYT
jgi:hypothetical protein